MRKAADDETSERLLKQMARELFLMQSSDWQFLISTKTAGDYGESRFLGHYQRVQGAGAHVRPLQKERGLERAATARALRLLEEKDALFDNVKLEWFKERTEDGL